MPESITNGIMIAVITITCCFGASAAKGIIASELPQLAVVSTALDPASIGQIRELGDQAASGLDGVSEALPAQ